MIFDFKGENLQKPDEYEIETEYAPRAKISFSLLQNVLYIIDKSINGYM